MVLWGRAQFGLIFLLLSWGCTGPPGGSGTPTPGPDGPRLDVTVIVPPASAPDPFDALTFYRVTVLAGGNVVTTADIPVGDPLEVDGLEPASQVRLVLEGHDANGLVSRGRTRAFDLTASQVQDAYLYFAQINTFNDVNGPAVTRTGAYTAQLSDDKVIIGGGDVGGTASTPVDLYDPDTDTIETLPDAPSAHAHAVAVALDADTIFIVGGLDGAAAPTANGMVFEYDSSNGSGTWTAATPMTEPRANGAGASLGNSQVLVAGGFDGTDILDTSEVFTWDGAAGSWEDAPQMQNQREGPLAFAVGPGQALVGMGSEGPDQYNRDLRLYTYFPANMGQPAGDYDFVHLLPESRAFTGFAALGDNQFLLLGGLGNNDEPVEDVDLIEYVPSIEDVIAFQGNNLPSPRVVGGTHVMEDGQVLLIGGDEGPLGAPAPINEALTYDPTTMQFTDLGALPGVTTGAVVAALPDGTLLCVLDGQVKRYNP